jgi:hypothetical protein
MLVDWKALVCGQPIRTVHDFLRKHFGYPRNVKFVHDELAPRYFGSSARKVIEELISRGWLERKTEGGEEVYDLASDGNRFAIVKRTPPLTRSKGEAIIAGVIERAEAINRRPELCCSVARLTLFGSMLDPTIPVVSDVDIAFELRRREHPEGKDWVEWNIERFEASARESGSYIDTIYFGETEVVRLLKADVRGLSLHPQRDLDGIAAKSVVASRLIYSADARGIQA